MIIGICGGSGSGKTTLLKRLATTFSEKNPSVFSMDNYYLPIEKQRLDHNGIVNFDLPTALDENRLTTDLRTLTNGDPIEFKEYHLNPSELIIVEGLFLFHYQGVRELLDFSVFVDVDPDVQLDRRLYRDQETRGYSREDIIYQWDNHVLPCYENYLHPYKKDASFIFRNDHRADEDFTTLEFELKSRLVGVNV
jgi:uridine kinase